MRIGLNMIRITAEAERDWQRPMQEPNVELEQQAVAARGEGRRGRRQGDKHISKTRSARKVTPPDTSPLRVLTKRRTAEETPP